MSNIKRHYVNFTHIPSKHIAIFLWTKPFTKLMISSPISQTAYIIDVNLINLIKVLSRTCVLSAECALYIIRIRIYINTRGVITIKRITFKRIINFRETLVPLRNILFDGSRQITYLRGNYDTGTRTKLSSRDISEHWRFWHDVTPKDVDIYPGWVFLSFFLL